MNALFSVFSLDPLLQVRCRAGGLSKNAFCDTPPAAELGKDI